MTNIRRYFREGDISFLTHVTHNRQPILIDHFELLWSSIEKAKEENKFEIISWVILPDHFHLVIDPKTNELPNLMKRIKLSFSAKYRKSVEISSGRVWQNRFWDHIIRNEEDLRRHIDYVHYNPVKHGLVNSPKDWRFTSFHDFLNNGDYPADWGVRETMTFDGSFGE